MADQFLRSPRMKTVLGIVLALTAAIGVLFLNLITSFYLPNTGVWGMVLFPLSPFFIILPYLFFDWRLCRHGSGHGLLKEEEPDHFRYFWLDYCLLEVSSLI